jgi:hypothetical protein
VPVGDDIARSLTNMGREIDRAVKAVNREAGKVAREEAEELARRSTGGDRRFSRFKGPALGVRLRVDTDGVTVSPSGPWKIAEEGAKAGGRGRHRNHPGTASTQGVKAWSRGRDGTVQRLDRDVPKTIDRAADRGFRG